MHHIALPLRLAADGSLLALTEDSPSEIVQSVQTLLATRVGERASEPSYGSADPLYGPVLATGQPPAEISASTFTSRRALVDASAVTTWESRAAGVVDVTATASY